MPNRIINLSVEDWLIRRTGESAGAAGASNAVTLRMAFDAHWDGTAKTVYFLDANGENAVGVTLGLDRLVSGETAIYDVAIPAEAMAVPGMAAVTVKGVETSGGTAVRVLTTSAAQFRVSDSGIPADAGNAGIVTASDKDQLQGEIDKLNGLFTTSVSACKTSETNAAGSEAKAAASACAAAQTVSGFDVHATEKQSAVDASAKAAAEDADAARSSAVNAAASASDAAVSAEKAKQIAGGDYETHTEALKKADKAVPEVTGNFAGLDAEGNLTDSGKQAGDFAPAAHAATHAAGGGDPLTPEDIGAATAKEIQDALAQFSACPFSAGTAAPGNTNLLWIDTGNGNILKYYDTASKSWKGINFVWG